MVKVIPFSMPYDDIARFRTTLSEKYCIFIAQSNRHDTMSSFRRFQAVQICHNLFFQFILICWIYDTINYSSICQSMLISTFNVQINHTFALNDRFGLCPVDTNNVAIFILKSYSISKLFHNRCAHTIHINQKRNRMRWGNLCMVREDKNSPALIQQMQEFTKVIVRLDIQILHPFFSNFDRVSIKWTICKMFNEHVFFKVNCMIMTENNIKIFTFNKVKNSSRLPICSHIPVCQHAFRDKKRILAANHRSWSWIANIFCDFSEKSLWVPYAIIRCIHTC